TVGGDASWWHLLHDDAIDALTKAAFADNPTLIQALSRVEEARADLGVKGAATMPAVDLDANVTRTKSRNTSPIPSGVTKLSNSASAGPAFIW
ncbi:TolC family protein, partial [Pseudomonas viridiflava]|uniref:TolC family protein n=1 Tax=Pseudomonas viridiflava TaxID=33069 RepID=UPI0013DFDB9B